MRRILFLCTIVGATVAGLWAVPAGQAGSVPASSAAPHLGPEPAPAPQLDEPDTSSAIDLAEAVTSGPAPADESDAPSAAPHLTPESVPAAAAPAPILTTTTLPPTTLPPTTLPAPTLPPTTAAPAVTIAFHAEQAYGSCGEDVPYDVFSGTANPGSTVTISSPHGSGSAVADGQGHWTRTVEFPTAPRGTTFRVDVRGVGGSASFDFTATGGDHA